MANWTRLGTGAEIPAGGCKIYEADGNRIAVFNVEGAFHAIDNSCIHRGGPLGEGAINGKIVTCLWHHWSYDVTTGNCTLSDSMGVKKYPVDLRGDELFVDLA